MATEKKHQIFSAKRMVWRRKNLRQKATLSEILLWQKLRRNNLEYKFKRQYSVENFVVDFYCPDCKLAIELDGEIHIKKKIYDEYRTKFLESYGINEIRFKNDQVLNDIEIVIDEIKKHLFPSPKRRRGAGGEVERKMLKSS